MFAAILLKSPGCPTKVSPQALRAMADAFGAGTARTYEALDGSEAYTYLDIQSQERSPQAFTSAVQAKAAELFADSGVTALALNGVKDIAGASKGEVAPYFYTVEITSKRENTAAVSAWYDEEHMPGLAAVPGCVRARRYLTDGAEQTSCACYEISNADIRETAAWNAVRGTPWSLEVKPYFVRLKRNMFRALPEVAF
jgi:hypothetical protein